MNSFFSKQNGRKSPQIGVFNPKISSKLHIMSYTIGYKNYKYKKQIVYSREKQTQNHRKTRILNSHMICGSLRERNELLYFLNIKDFYTPPTLHLLMTHFQLALLLLVCSPFLFEKDNFLQIPYLTFTDLPVSSCHRNILSIINFLRILQKVTGVHISFSNRKLPTILTK